jgi:hypothetical protein
MADVLAELEEIREQHGVLTPTVVLGVASNPDHPLHDQFEWDDTVAAHRFRVSQARRIIQATRIERITDDQVLRVRAYVSVRGPSEPSNYRPVDDLTDMERSLLVMTMRREIASLRRKFGHLQEFWALLDEERGTKSA